MRILLTQVRRKKNCNYNKNQMAMCVRVQSRTLHIAHSSTFLRNLFRIALKQHL